MPEVVIAYPFIAASIPEAARAAGVGETTVKQAIAKGDLTVHYAGARATKPLVLASDLHEWVLSLPTERGGRR